MIRNKTISGYRVKSLRHVPTQLVLCSTLTTVGCYEFKELPDLKSSGLTRDQEIEEERKLVEEERLAEEKKLTPSIDAEGRIHSDHLDIEGRWYVYGDAYGNPKTCIDMGKHLEKDCSVVNVPSVHLPALGFKNYNGEMCVSGTVAQLLPCCLESGVSEDEESGNLLECNGENNLNCPDDNRDHSSIWGAGIGFDFKLSPDANIRDFQAFSERQTWQSSEHQVIGISFDLQWHASDEQIPLRVEFPMRFEEVDVQLPLLETENGKTIKKGTLRAIGDSEFEAIEGGQFMSVPFSTEEHPYGSPYYQRPAEDDWKPSPVEQGPNTILWTDVFAPPDSAQAYMKPRIEGQFTGDNLLGVQFHVIPDKLARKKTEFSFCISNLKFLTEEENTAE